MLIVDEAHHLEWSESEVSPEYALVDELAKQTEAVLLLTATPQQLGPEGHFARLRLLDGDRFSDLKTYLKESDSYESLSDLLTKLGNGELPTASEVKNFGKSSHRVKEGMEKLIAGDEGVRNQLVEDLLDSFGPGRVMFRNTRDHLKGFPVRSANLVKVEEDGKVKWLAGLIRELGLGKSDKKILLIVKTRAEAESIAEGLKAEINVETALFHEDLTLIQRDKNATFFADEEGAQVLLCSEIGSEGRNFQFAHHLVLYDLPEDPELLEQRIGRLDRIGQTEKIHIHVPYESGTEGEVIARWYHEGLDAFEHNVHGATEVYRACGEMLELLKMSFSEEAMLDLISFSRKQMEVVKKKLMSGKEKLLALNSYRSKDAQKLIEVIDSFDQSVHFEKFTLKLLDHLGLAIEDIAERTYLLSVGHIKTDLASYIPEDGLVVTFDRDYALCREEVSFISMDHPLVRNALEIALAGDIGNASFGVWENSGEKAVYLEAYFVVEVLAPSCLYVDKFLSARPVKILVNHHLADVTEQVDLKKVNLREGNLRKLLANEMLRTKLIPAMMDASEKFAEAEMGKITEAAVLRIGEIKGAELSRLEDLAEINAAVSLDEINQLKSKTEELISAVKSARIRLDGLRLVWRT
jgi:ATP-dependent helicase HepA